MYWGRQSYLLRARTEVPACPGRQTDADYARGAQVVGSRGTSGREFRSHVRDIQKSGTRRGAFAPSRRPAVEHRSLRELLMQPLKERTRAFLVVRASP